MTRPRLGPELAKEIGGRLDCPEAVEAMDRKTADRLSSRYLGLISFLVRKARDISTASYDQVSRPIYSSAVGRAERFGACLDPLRKSLDDGA